jgi:hypothetical protein
MTADARGRVVEGLVTTIIPVHNRPVLLGEAVASVLRQAYRPIEVIVVDDGSTDETAAAADALARTHGAVRVVHRPNGGPGAARETGRRLARGEYVQYLDSDDVLLPGKFERQVSGLCARPDCGVSYGTTLASVGRPWKRTGEAIETMFPAFLASRWWHTSTPLYRRSVVDAAGPWADLWQEEDWEYDCRVAALGVRLHHTPELVSEQRAHAPARLSHDGLVARARLRDRAAAHRLILGHARRAGIGPEVREMQHFARALFHLARQCGAAGLPADAETLFGLARAASGARRGNGLDFRCYASVARVVGWQWAGRVASLAERLRPVGPASRGA